MNYYMNVLGMTEDEARRAIAEVAVEQLLEHRHA
jgi:hypothetical protein